MTKGSKDQSMQVRTMQVSKVREGQISEIQARSWMSISIGLYWLPVVGGISR